MKENKENENTKPSSKNKNAPSKNQGYSYLKNQTPQNTSSKEFHKQLSMEILDMLAIEREREKERQEKLKIENNPDKIRELNHIFTKERLDASNLIIEKQKYVI